MRRCIFIILIVLMLVSCNANFANSSTQQGGENMKDVTEYIMLYANVSPFTSGDGLQFFYNDFYNPKTLESDEASVVNEIIRGYKIQFVSLSSDGSKALFETLDALPKYKVFDLKSKRIIFEIEDSDYETSMGMYMHIKFLPNLTKYIKIIEDEYYLCSIDGNSPIKLKDLNNVNLFNCIFSPDERMISFTEEIEGKNQISIYDMSNMKTIKKIVIGEENIWINQWHSTGKLLYNYDLDGYMIDIETEKVKDLGKYAFYPLLSPDGRYLAYSHPLSFVYIDSMLDADETYESTVGLYILDNKTGKTTKLDTDIYFQQEPIQWIDKKTEVLIR